MKIDNTEHTLPTGETLLIRELVPADAARARELFLASHSESDNLNYVPGEFTLSVEEEREFIAKRQADPLTVSLVGLIDGEMVALAGLTPPTFRRERHKVEFGVTVMKAHWRKGIGRILTERCIELAKKIGVRKLTLRVYEDNEGAHKLYESMGFVEEARLKDDTIRRGGGYRDTIVMAMFFDPPTPHEL